MNEEDQLVKAHRPIHIPIELTEVQKEIAAIAAQLIIDHGWVQGVYGDENCGFCVIGAIGSAADILSNPIHYYTNRRAIENAVEHRTCNFPTRWNDEEGRTMEDVVGLLQNLAEGN